jgi:hypothetical protein
MKWMKVKGPKAAMRSMLLQVKVFAERTCWAREVQ